MPRPSWIPDVTRDAEDPLLKSKPPVPSRPARPMAMSTQAHPATNAAALFGPWGCEGIITSTPMMAIGLDAVRTMPSRMLSRTTPPTGTPARFARAPDGYPGPSERRGERTLRVLVVEDEELLADAVARGLRRQG